MKFAYLGAAAAVAAFAMAAPASAEIYGALNAGVQTIKFDDAPILDDGRLPVAGARIGWRVNKWVGAEGDLFFGLKEDRIHEQPPVDVKVDSAAFAYGVVFIPATAQFDLIARAGYGHLAGKLEGAGVDEATNDGAFTYGVGAQYRFDAANGVRIDYTRYDITDVPIDGFTVAYVRTF